MGSERFYFTVAGKKDSWGYASGFGGEAANWYNGGLETHRPSASRYLELSLSGYRNVTSHAPSVNGDRAGL